MVAQVRTETRIIDDGDESVTYAAGYDGVWLTLEVTTGGGALGVDLHSSFAVADTDKYSQIEFITGGEPAHDCRLLSGECWTVAVRGYSGSAEMLPESGVPGEVDYDAEVLHRLSQAARDASFEAEEMRVGWRVRLARRVVRWAVTPCS